MTAENSGPESAQPSTLAAQPSLAKGGAITAFSMPRDPC